ncbi:glycosyltransferase family 2 protein [Persicobacter psychrovividus]|uniref:glycosyltransferase family 2 protein n=1 Tax=Persicobacter psychrovividus TaxID=387638 RepID=UPI002FCE09C6
MNNQSAFISLIITTYNRPDALALVLESVKQQTLLPKEVIIADDGSRDETRKTIEAVQENFPVPLRHCWQEDDGFRLAKIRNKAIAMAQGSYIIMIDGDIILSKSVVFQHEKQATPNTFIQGSRVLIGPMKTQQLLQSGKTAFSFFTRDLRCRENKIQSRLLFELTKNKYQGSIRGIKGCHMSYWKENVIAINGFNEAFEGWGREDTDFAIRMMNQGFSRKNLKFIAPTGHLYHPERSMHNHEKNNDLAMRAQSMKSTVCDKGIAAYLDTATQ